MPYYQLMPDIYADLGDVIDSPNVPDPESPYDNDTIYFRGGEVITSPIPNPLEFEVSCIDKAPHLLGAEIPIMSSALMHCFNSLGIDNLQFFPALLRNPDTGISWDNYFAFNVIGLVDAVDTEASTSSTIMDGDEQGLVTPLLAYDKLVFSRKKLQNIDIFRLPQDNEIYISERVLLGLRDMKPEGGWGFNIKKIEIK